MRCPSCDKTGEWWCRGQGLGDWGSGINGFVRNGASHIPDWTDDTHAMKREGMMLVGEGGLGDRESWIRVFCQA